eukprot:3333546-Rhodomonas_salina.2
MRKVACPRRRGGGVVTPCQTREPIAACVLLAPAVALARQGGLVPAARANPVLEGAVLAPDREGGDALLALL